MAKKRDALMIEIKGGGGGAVENLYNELGYGYVIDNEYIETLANDSYEITSGWTEYASSGQTSGKLMSFIPDLPITTNDATSMFQNCYRLQTIPQLDYSGVSNFNSMFQNCYNLSGNIYINLDNTNITNLTNIFNSSGNGNLNVTIEGDGVLTAISTANLAGNTSSNPFYGVSKLIMNTPNIESGRNICYNNKILTDASITLTKNRGSNGKLNAIFSGCNNLKNCYLKTSMEYAGVSNDSFSNCTSLENLTLIPSNDSGLIDGLNSGYMFNFSTCTALSVDSLVGILSLLNPSSSYKTMNLGATNLAKLTPEQIEIGTSRGWTII